MAPLLFLFLFLFFVFFAFFRLFFRYYFLFAFFRCYIDIFISRLFIFSIATCSQHTDRQECSSSEFHPFGLSHLNSSFCLSIILYCPFPLYSWVKHV
ncbi:hypothetical protein D9754_10260 [Planomicrobium sp. Y74]|nr:hypothetical protein D9754_10260 [Planomicrobium sp. Y74]